MVACVGTWSSCPVPYTNSKTSTLLERGDMFAWQHVIFYIWLVKGLTSIAAVEIHRKLPLIRKRNNRTPLRKVGRRDTQDGSDSVGSYGGSLIIW